MNRTSKIKTLSLGIGLIVLAVLIIILFSRIDSGYTGGAKPGYLQIVAVALSVLFTAGGAAMSVLYAQKSQQKHLNMAIAMFAAAILVALVHTAIVRQMDREPFDLNLGLHLLISALLLAFGFAKKKPKLWVGGLIFLGFSFLLRGFGNGIYPASEYAARLKAATTGVGFNFRFFYFNPALWISMTAIGWALGIIMILIGVAMLIAQMMGGAGLRAGRATTNTFIYILLTVVSVVWMIPFVCILLQSFRVESTNPVGYVLPQKWGFDNYVSLFRTNFPRWYLNTFIIALFVAVLQTVIVLCMSYTLSRFRFKMRKPLMRMMLVLTLFPGMLTMIILYRVLADLGLTKEHAVPGLILVYVASSGMGYYVSKGFFDTIPKSLDEAARVDGATRAQVLYKIILPLSKPIVIYTILTAFMGPWGDYVFARYISVNEELGMNVAVGLWKWLTPDQIANHYTHFCAGGVLVAVPVTILFMCLQRYYVEGVTGGAVKG